MTRLTYRVRRAAHDDNDSGLVVSAPIGVDTTQILEQSIRNLGGEWPDPAIERVLPKVELPGWYPQGDECLCRECRRLFARETGYAAHRVDGECVDPAGFGLDARDHPRSGGVVWAGRVRVAA